MGYELRVIEITTGRVVFEEMTDEGFETVIIRVEDEDSSKFGIQSSKVRKQRIERIRKTVSKQPLLFKPRGIKRDKTTDGDNTKRSKYQNSSE